MYMFVDKFYTLYAYAYFFDKINSISELYYKAYHNYISDRLISACVFNALILFFKNKYIDFVLKINKLL